MAKSVGVTEPESAKPQLPAGGKQTPSGKWEVVSLVLYLDCEKSQEPVGLEVVNQLVP